MDPSPPPPNDSAAPIDVKPDLPSPSTPAVDPSATPATTDDVKMEVVEEETLPAEILNASADEVMARVRMLDNDVKVSWNPLCLSVAPPPVAARERVDGGSSEGDMGA